jgi:hypothetical protein
VRDRIIQEKSLKGPLQLLVTDDGFLATAAVKLSRNKTQTLNIRQDSRVWAE